MSALLDARDLYRFFHSGDDEVLALRGVSLTVDAGEIVAVRGPSGSGKSTLLTCLAGLDVPDGGMVRVAGVPVSRRPERVRARLRAERIGVLYQSDNLLEHLSLTQNLQLVRRLAARRDPPPITSLLERLGLLARASARPSELSGGETARAGLAVALANDPDVLLADEPTGELDRANATRVTELLQERAASGSAVCVVTHNDDVAAYADRSLLLVDGRLVA